MAQIRQLAPTLGPQPSGDYADPALDPWFPGQGIDLGNRPYSAAGILAAALFAVPEVYTLGPGDFVIAFHNGQPVKITYANLAAQLGSTGSGSSSVSGAFSSDFSSDFQGGSGASTVTGSNFSSDYSEDFK